jgi:chromosome segregation ATPase
MALEKSFEELSAQIRKFYERLHELNRTVLDASDENGRQIEDRPELVDQLEDAVLEVIGSLEEKMLDLAIEADRIASQAVDRERTRRALKECQEQLRLIEEQFNRGLGKYEVLAELDRIAVKRGGQWLHWATAARPGIENCREPLQEIRNALTTCWEELTERGDIISIQATTIGTQIVNTVPEPKEMVAEGTT